MRPGRSPSAALVAAACRRALPESAGGPGSKRGAQAGQARSPSKHAEVVGEKPSSVPRLPRARPDSLDLPRPDRIQDERGRRGDDGDDAPPAKKCRARLHLAVERPVAIRAQRFLDRAVDEDDEHPDVVVEPDGRGGLGLPAADANSAHANRWLRPRRLRWAAGRRRLLKVRGQAHGRGAGWHGCHAAARPVR